MTVKFFPLFWKNEAGLTPVNTQMIYLAVPLVMVVFGLLSAPLGRFLGRTQAITLFRVIGICSLYLLTWLVGQTANAWILVPVYLIRTGLMNAIYPLEESVVMDNVSSATRARWKSLDSIQQFGWCGSAALGGIFIDSRGYEATFQLTAAIQLFATLAYVPLFWIVPKQESPAAPKAISGGSAKGAGEKGAGLVEPAVATRRSSGSGDLSAPLLDVAR